MILMPQILDVVSNENVRYKLKMLCSRKFYTVFVCDMVYINDFNTVIDLGDNTFVIE